jgi:hypothetical protein
VVLIETSLSSKREDDGFALIGRYSVRSVGYVCDDALDLTTEPSGTDVLALTSVVAGGHENAAVRSCEYGHYGSATGADVGKKKPSVGAPKVMPPLQVTRMSEIVPSQKKTGRGTRRYRSPNTYIVTENVFRAKLEVMLKTKATPAGPVVRRTAEKDEAGD